MPEKFSALLSRAARKSLDNLREPQLGQIREKLRQICAAPDDPRLSIQLTGATVRRARCGDLRILYTLDHNSHSITVLDVLPRDKAYRNF